MITVKMSIRGNAARSAKEARAPIQFHLDESFPIPSEHATKFSRMVSYIRHVVLHPKFLEHNNCFGHPFMQPGKGPTAFSDSALQVNVRGFGGDDRTPYEDRSSRVEPALYDNDGFA